MSKFAFLLAFCLLLPATGLAEHHMVSGEVAVVSEEYGNLDTNIMQKPFEATGVKQGDFFTATVGDKSARVLYGKTYSDVKKGEWIAFITDYGNLRIARSFASAAEGLSASQGDPITVSPVTDD